MKNKSIALGVLLIAVLSVAVYYFASNTKTNTLKRELSNFAVQDTSSITKIFMADKSGKDVTLERINSKTWKLNGRYIAKSSTMNTLLETIYSIRVKETVPKTAFNTVVKRLATQAVKVEIYLNNELSKTYYVGGPTLDYYGTYMLLENSSTPYVMWIQGFEGYLTTRYFTDETVWRSNYIFPQSPLDLSAIRIEYPKNPELSFELSIFPKSDTPNEVDFQIKSLKTGKAIAFDENAVKAYLLQVKSISFETIANKMNAKTKDSTLALPPMHVITVTDKNGKLTHLKTFPRKGREGQVDEKGDQLPYDLDRFYALINKEPELFTVQYYVFDKLLKPITYFEK